MNLLSHTFSGDPWGACSQCQHPAAHEIHLTQPRSDAPDCFDLGSALAELARLSERVEHPESSEALVERVRQCLFGYSGSGPIPDARTALDALAARLKACEDYLERLRAIGDQTVREEVITRRILWALRGSNDEPPHPDRAPAPEAPREEGR